MKDKYNIIRNAIKNKQQVFGKYLGRYRELCPHVLGYTNGKAQALFYQFGGESNSRPIEAGSTKNWRCMELDLLEINGVQDGEWHTANNHEFPQHCVQHVDIEVRF